MPEKVRKTFAAEEDLLLQANEKVCYRQLLNFHLFGRVLRMNHASSVPVFRVQL